MRFSWIRNRSRTRWFAAFAAFTVIVIGFAVAGCERNTGLVANEQIIESQNPCPEGCEFGVPGCFIKGKVSPEGEKRFVTRSNQFYNNLEMSYDAGDRWFCTEAEAINNGFLSATTN